MKLRSAFVIAAAIIASAVGLSLIEPVKQAIAQAEQQLLTLQSSDHITVNRPGSATLNFARPPMFTSQSEYTKVAPVTGFALTFRNFQTYLLLSPTGGLAAGTVTLAPAPADGARECIFSTQTISTLTVSANAGQAINGAVTTLAANTGACYLYSITNLTWDRN